jgi:lysophospholipase L1-like esterase
MAFGKLGAMGRGMGHLGALGGAGWWLPGAVAAIDFTPDSGPRTYGGSLASMFSFARSAVRTDLFPWSPSGYAYSTRAIDTSCVIPGRGLSSERIVTNYFLNSNAPVTQSVTLGAAGDYTLWMNGPGSATLTPNTGTISLANGSNNVATNSNVVIFNVVAAGTVVDVTIAGTLYAAQLENSAGGTSFIITAGSPVQRGEDKPTIIGTPAIIGVNASPFTGAVVIASEATNGTPNFSTILRIGSQAVGQNFFPTSAYFNNNSGGNSISTVLGSGDRSDAVFGVTWNSSSRNIVANGGSPNSGSTLYATTNPTIALGNGPDGNAFNGFIKSVNFFLTEQPVETLRTFTKKSRNFRLTAFGDSLTARADGLKASAASSDFGPLANSSISYPSALETLFGNAFNILNGGVEAQTSTQIKTRFLNTPSLWGLPTIIRAGNNNYASPTTVKDDIAAMVAVLTTPNYLILPVLNGRTEPSGNANYISMMSLNTDLAAIYGSDHFFDDRALLVAATPSNGVDTIDQGNDVPQHQFRCRNTQGRITVAIDASVTTFTTNTSGLLNRVLQIENEFILVTATSGSTVTNCTRGYGSSTAASHAQHTRYSATDVLHLGESGRQFIAQKIYDKIQALGGWGL